MRSGLNGESRLRNLYPDRQARSSAKPELNRISQSGWRSLVRIAVMGRKIARRMILAGIVLLLIPLMSACGSGNTPGSATPAGDPKLSYDFRNGPQGWVGDFAEYPSGEEQSYQL